MLVHCPSARLICSLYLDDVTVGRLLQVAAEQARAADALAAPGSRALAADSVVGGGGSQIGAGLGFWAGGLLRGTADEFGGDEEIRDPFGGEHIGINSNGNGLCCLRRLGMCPTALHRAAQLLQQPHAHSDASVHCLVMETEDNK